MKVSVVLWIVIRLGSGLDYKATQSTHPATPPSAVSWLLETLDNMIQTNWRVIISFHFVFHFRSRRTRRKEESWQRRRSRKGLRRKLSGRPRGKRIGRRGSWRGSRRRTRSRGSRGTPSRRRARRQPMVTLRTTWTKKWQLEIVHESKPEAKQSKHAVCYDPMSRDLFDIFVFSWYLNHTPLYLNFADGCKCGKGILSLSHSPPKNNQKPTIITIITWKLISPPTFSAHPIRSKLFSYLHKCFY